MPDNGLFPGVHQTTFLGASLLNWGAALAAALASWLAMHMVLRLLLGRAGAVAHRTSTRLDDMLVELLQGTSRLLVAVAALLVGVSVLELSPAWSTRLGHLWFVAVALQVGLWGNRAVDLALRHWHHRHAGGGATAQQVSTSATLLSWALRTALWAVLLLAMLANLGVNITALVASLGVGGVAVALAVQNILGDLFASLSIAVDKPFEVGDFITLGSVAGTVEHVGLKTTRIRALGGEQVVISNTELLKQTINNFKRMQERRVVFRFGITYDSSPEQAEALPAAVKQVVETLPHTRFDRAHFTGFGDSSLDYEVVYFVLSPDYNLYMDLQQRINLDLMRQCRALGVDFAFPTRTVVLQNPVPGQAPAQPASP